MKNWLTVLILSSVILLSTIPLAHSQIPEQIGTKLQNGDWQVPTNKQVQIAADVTSGQNRAQPFAYIVQIQDQNGVVIQLSWLTGTLEPGQSLSPSQSWTPTMPGEYTAQVFVWEGISNPNALSVPLTMKITVT